jgi:hypothetical protein
MSDSRRRVSKERASSSRIDDLGWKLGCDAGAPDAANAQDHDNDFTVLDVTGS